MINKRMLPSVRRRAFTLIEVIVAIVLVGIFMYAGMGVMMNSGKYSVVVENLSVAQSLAEERLEMAMARPYASISSEALTNFTGNLSSYSYETIVEYVTPGNLDSTSVSDTGYKRIRVFIRNPLMANPVKLESIKADY